MRKKIKSPAISVVMPVFNMENYISEAMESIINQTFVDFEFIIIDDASTDNTKNIIDSYKDSRILRINNNIKKGNHISRNLALEICKGKYVCMMDADDISCLDRLEKQYVFMENNLKYAVAGTDIHIIFENNFQTTFQYLRDEREVKVHLLQDNVCSHPSLILRKDFLHKYNIKYDEEYYYSADYNLLLDISKVGNITNIPEFLLFYRKHPEQISSKKLNYQKMYRNQIQLKQLSNFKVRPSIDEFNVHQHLMNELPLSKRQLDIAERWCNKLLTKNHKLKIYDQDYLYIFLRECLLKTIHIAQYIT